MVILSIIEMVLAAVDPSGGGGGLSVLRTFRLLRVFKLARSFHDLQALLRTLLNSLAGVSTSMVLTLLMMFIFTLLGMFLYGGQWDAEAFGGRMTSRANFDGFGWGFITVFQVLTGENWNDLFWAGLDTHGFASVVYLIVLQFLGNYMIMNLFLAILLGGFEDHPPTILVLYLPQKGVWEDEAQVIQTKTNAAGLVLHETEGLRIRVTMTVGRITEFDGPITITNTNTKQTVTMMAPLKVFENGMDAGMARDIEKAIQEKDESELHPRHAGRYLALGH